MLRLIATFRPLDSKTIIGYRLMTEDKGLLARLSQAGVTFRGNVGDFSVQETIQILVKFGAINFTLDSSKRNIILLDGSMDSLPILNPKTGGCIENNVIIVLSAITYNDETIGYRVCNYAGTIAQLRYNDLLSKEKQGFANAKVVSRDGKTFISAIRGSFPSTPLKVKDDKMPRMVVSTGTNYETLIDTTKQRGSVSIPVKYFANSNHMKTTEPTSTGHVALSDNGDVIYRYRDQHGDTHFSVVPRDVFNANFQLGVASTVTKQERSNTPPAPSVEKSNTTYLKELTEKHGIGTILNVTFFRNGSPDSLKGQVRLNKGIIQLRSKETPTSEPSISTLQEEDFNTNFRITSVIKPKSP